MKREEIRAERKRQGLTIKDVATITGLSKTNVNNIEVGIRSKRKDADKVLKALGIQATSKDIEDVEQEEYYIGRKYIKPCKTEHERTTWHKHARDTRPHPVYPDTLAIDNKEAARLGLSYGEYMAKKETGTLEQYKRQQEQLAKRDSKANIIQSHIDGSPGARKATNASKL